MGKAAAPWKKEIRRLQQNCCYICSELTTDARPGSWDHFVPQVYQGKNIPLRVGLSFWAHAKCNSARGHEAPTNAMIARALSVLNALPLNHQREAHDNINLAIKLHRQYIETLSRMTAVLPTIPPRPSKKERVAAALAGLAI